MGKTILTLKIQHKNFLPVQPKFGSVLLRGGSEHLVRSRPLEPPLGWTDSLLGASQTLMRTQNGRTRSLYQTQETLVSELLTFKWHREWSTILKTTSEVACGQLPNESAESH